MRALRRRSRPRERRGSHPQGIETIRALIAQGQYEMALEEISHALDAPTAAGEDRFALYRLTGVVHAYLGAAMRASAIRAFEIARELAPTPVERAAMLVEGPRVMTLLRFHAPVSGSTANGCR